MCLKLKAEASQERKVQVSEPPEVGLATTKAELKTNAGEQKAFNFQHPKAFLKL